MASVKPIGITKLVVNKFIKKGEEFAYIRRYRTELSKAVPKFFDAVKSNNEFAGHSLRSNGNKFYIDDKVARLFYDTRNLSGLKIY